MFPYTFITKKKPAEGDQFAPACTGQFAPASTDHFAPARSDQFYRFLHFKTSILLSNDTCSLREKSLRVSKLLKMSFFDYILKGWLLSGFVTDLQLFQKS